MTFYITATDRFMSKMLNQTSKVIYVTEDRHIADELVFYANTRKDFKYVNWSENKPKYPKSYDVKYYNENKTLIGSEL